MKRPLSTYRVQLSSEFPFKNLEEIIPYLEEFGISTVYSSPFFQARKGSTHGYDIVNPLQINEDIGDIEEFRKISQDLQKREMNWLQDIVPNHMAFDASNIWLADIFELGELSRFYRFFDVYWEKGGKLMAPFLGDSLENVIKNNELEIIFEETAFHLKYFDHYYPVSAKTYAFIFAEIGEEELREEVLSASKTRASWQKLKSYAGRLIKEKKGIREKTEDLLMLVNQDPEKFNEVLDLQYFAPVYWQTTEKEINYRRFFTINDLICLRMEDPEVFDEYHQFIAELCQEGLITGLRIDHIDGLFDPAGYLNRLEKLVGKDFYVIVEKILEWDEPLRETWKTQGTSGYAFLALVNNLLTAEKNEKRFTATYSAINPELADYEALVYEKKLFILLNRMGGELQNLMELLQDLLPGKKKMQNEFRVALSAFMAAFPVYRIYPGGFPLPEPEQKTIEQAAQKALDYEPVRKAEIEFLKLIYLGEAKADKDKMLYFLQRCQQFTGPLAAKGVEDTSFYIYNNLISHNEVGDSPHIFGISIERFHREMEKRQKNWPFAINATATHDTKRGEDARMRINVLSEVPQEWFKKVEHWKKINQKFKTGAGPDENEEYFIYQSLIGALPFADKLPENFLTRTKNYLQKVLREAKQHSNWSQPDSDYEKQVFDFLTSILNDSDFRNSFDDFQAKIARQGAIKSLSQSLVKITAPGIPDIYQGTELWDFSYVDPDNRRPVNYPKRKKILEEFKNTGKNELIKNLLQDLPSGKIKMYTLHKALVARTGAKEVFEKGAYIPLKLSGEFAENILGFARKFEQKWYIVLVPVNCANIIPEGELPVGNNFWKNTSLALPETAPREWENVFTGRNTDISGPTKLGDLLEKFPVALLRNF